MCPSFREGDSSRFDRFIASKAAIFAGCGFIIALDLVLYWKSLGLYFIQDDFAYLWLTSDRTIQGFLKLFNTQNVFYRPISNHLHFFLMQSLFGLNPFPYHACNLLIHIINSLAVGYLVYLMTENRALAFASSIIFTSRVGHVIAVYWICVTTQSMPLMFFLLSLICYIHFRRAGRRWLIAVSYFLFALCVFSNINGFTLVLLITAYDLLVREDRSFISIGRRESGFYVVVLAFLLLQFVVFGYEPTSHYQASIGLVSLQNFGSLNIFAHNLLYLIDYFADYPPAMVIVGFLAGLATIAAAFVGFLDCMRQKLPREARMYLFFGFWYLLGCAPYLPLADHVRLADRIWPQYITTAAVGLSFISAGLLARVLRTKGLVLALCLILALSAFSIRVFEKEEYETKGTLYKSEVARNVISDLRENLERDPGVERIIILNGQVELFWILHYGRNAEVFLDRFKPIFYVTSSEGIRPDPTSLVLRYEGMHLHKIY